jgi:hypothetical protein
MGKKVSKVISKVVKPKKSTPAPAPAPAAAEPAVKMAATSSQEKKDIYDSATRRVRRGRAMGYRRLMTDRSTLGGEGSKLG